MCTRIGQDEEQAKCGNQQKWLHHWENRGEAYLITICDQLPSHRAEIRALNHLEHVENLMIDELRLVSERGLDVSDI